MQQTCVELIEDKMKRNHRELLPQISFLLFNFIFIAKTIDEFCHEAKQQAEKELNLEFPLQF